ncbi:MAG: DoxX family membrane protein [Candidatus Marinimicrobia bacterium]|nr:DoxX family membrane protein [Candidatus Neomarinimicrobiota bacterium]
MAILSRMRLDLNLLSPNTPWMRWPVLVGRFILGGLFVFSGAAKVLDAQTFMAALPLYQVPQWLIPLGALAPSLEIAVGVALMLGMAPRLMALATLGLLAAFSVLLVMGIVGGELGTCGCFGRFLETSPQLALVRNLVLALIAGVVWRFHRDDPVDWRRWQVLTLSGLLLVTGTLTGYTTHTPQIDGSLAKAGEFFPDEGFVEDGIELEGRQLAFVFAVSCHHCWDAVANVKALAADGRYGVFGVTASDPFEIEWFAEEFGTNFPIYSYDPVLFGEAFRSWPALYYMENGYIIAKLEGDIPSLKTLEEVHMAEWE